MRRCSGWPSRSASPRSCCPRSSAPAWRPARAGWPRRKVLVKRLVCIEDLGDIDILITDKTGTLTDGQVAFVDAVDPGRCNAQSRCCATGCWPPMSTRPPAAPAPTSSTPHCGRAAGRCPASPGSAFLPFDHDRRRQFGAGRRRRPARVLVVKGAPEQVLARCVEVSAGGTADAVGRCSPTGGGWSRWPSRCRLRADGADRPRRDGADARRVPRLRRQPQSRGPGLAGAGWRRWASRSRSPPGTTRRSPRRSAQNWVWPPGAP